MCKVSIICLTLVIITAIICFTIYKLRDVNYIKSTIAGIKSDVREIKCNLGFNNSLLARLVKTESAKSRKSNDKQ